MRWLIWHVSMSTVHVSVTSSMWHYVSNLTKNWTICHVNIIFPLYPMLDAWSLTRHVCDIFILYSQSTLGHRHTPRSSVWQQTPVLIKTTTNTHAVQTDHYHTNSEATNDIVHICVVKVCVETIGWGATRLSHSLSNLNIPASNIPGNCQRQIRCGFVKTMSVVPKTYSL